MTSRIAVEQVLAALAPAESDLDSALYALIGRVSRGDCRPTKKSTTSATRQSPDARGTK